ncbi:ABC nitrate/sulfonate/bicarbonate transporter, inner membrane subunit [Ketogulonicigenium robustum]|uniref:ABC nitrate/sulfonate/bicarbonate transporter, inner membrane subunit n=1 Tax=Ketogulonicigenium robustum TaxID=92947 RepID=A0A1W6NVX6_9RHOB|nr:ABC nitrate/sulfonate/bicarbonate transporter, inner membrane subunit [Ketogulonicigenium robustum]
MKAMAGGYLIGALAGIGLAFIGYAVQRLRAGADMGATLLHSIPAIALAPIFVLGFGRETAPTALAAFNAFFVFYVAASSGLSGNAPIFRDVMKVYGASPMRRFWHVDFPAALPAIATGMKLAVPGSLIGAILGEWFGAPRGLGLLIVTAMQNFQILLLWSAVLLTGMISFGLFCLLSLLERHVFERFR